MRTSRDQGSVLVVALVVAATASIAGMYMVLTSDLKVRVNRYLSRGSDASRVALAGLEVARGQLGASESWDGGVFQDPEMAGHILSIESVATGTMKAQVQSTGAVDDATRVVSADLRAVPHPALSHNIFSRGSIELSNVSCGGALRANGDVTAVGNVDFAGTVTTVDGSFVTSQIDSEQVLFESQIMSAPEPTLGSYQSQATPLFGVPFDPVASCFTLEKLSLRPDWNPFGALNPLGIYTFDAGGHELWIRDVFVLGMLMVRNCPHVFVEHGFHIARAAPDYPTLVVEGDLDLRLESALDESGLGIDFDGDGTFFGVHEASIAGLVWVEGDFLGTQSGSIIGTVIADSVRLIGSPAFKDNTLLDTEPVKGFIESGSWDVVAGSIVEGT